MSGLLRRIKRSRPADAGEPLPEGQAAAPEDAAPATDPATGPTQPLPGDAPAAEPVVEVVKDKPVLLADPDVPAGVDPATAPMRPPAGRRGRLRRRLRYLRRARELMLRDLGGLLYEIHRTGGGNVEAHGNIVRAKVQRISGLDAEAHALETALATPRADAIVFQPGVGGTCDNCGELYGSASHFCANCGSPIGGRALPAPAVADPAVTPAPASRESVFGKPSAPSGALSSGDPLRIPAREASDSETAASTTEDTAVMPPTGDETPGEPHASDETAATEAAAEPSASDDREATAAEPSASDDREATAAEPSASDDRNAIADADPADPITSDAPGATAGDPAASEDPASTDAEPATSNDPAAGTEGPAAAPADPAISDDPATSEDPAASEDPATSDDPAAGTEDSATNDDPSAETRDAGAADGADGAGHNPFSGLRNGRAEDHTPPELSSGDPLTSRESRS